MSSHPHRHKSSDFEGKKIINLGSGNHLIRGNLPDDMEINCDGNLNILGNMGDNATLDIRGNLKFWNAGHNLLATVGGDTDYTSVGANCALNGLDMPTMNVLGLQAEQILPEDFEKAKSGGKTIQGMHVNSPSNSDYSVPKAPPSSELNNIQSEGKIQPEIHNEKPDASDSTHVSKSRSSKGERKL